MQAPKDKRMDGGISPEDELASYVTRCLYKEREQRTKQLGWRWSRVHDGRIVHGWEAALSRKKCRRVHLRVIQRKLRRRHGYKMQIWI